MDGAVSIVPRLDALPAYPRRIILHWSGGGPNPSAEDLRAYHYCVSQSGEVFMGVPVERNMRQIPVTDPRSAYAAHTARLNSYSVGVALCGMRDAKPDGTLGPYPITRDQTYAAMAFVAELCDAWSLPVSSSTVFTHWEAEHLHGVKQAGKFDITVIPWLPRMERTTVGGYLRMIVRGSEA